MKYCERPFQHVYIMPNGDVRCCSWTTKKIGNLLENTLEEIWNSPAAEEIRESVRDGSFRFCRKNGYKNVLIYGFTNLGHRAYEELKDLRPVVADRRNLEWNGVRTVRAEECDLRQYDLIVVTPLNDEENLVNTFKKQTGACVLTIREWVEKLYSEIKCECE